MPSTTSVKKLANKNAAEFKKSTVIPKSAREFLEHMSGECDGFIPSVRGQMEDSEKRIGAALKKLVRRFSLRFPAV